MQLPVFQRNSRCTDCDLYKSARSVCIPMTALDIAGNAKTAVVLVGERPGIDEDRHDAHFVGEVGTRYAKGVYIRWIKQQTDGIRVDFYGVNAVRCAPPVNGTVMKSHITRCRSYWTADLALLRAAYDRVLVVACGGPAAQLVYGTSLGAALRSQGKTLSDGVTAFATMNPAVLLPTRDPSALRSIKEHLTYVVDYLLHNKLPMSLTVPRTFWPIATAPSNTIIAVDIETYGALEGVEQTVFHPRRSLEVDKVAREALIVTIAVAWRRPDGTLATHLYVMPDDLRVWEVFLDAAIKGGCHLLFQNAPFDVSYLRMFTDTLRGILSRPHMTACGSRLLELQVASFLESDTRTTQERGLKTTAKLLRVAEYDDSTLLKSGFRYADRYDPELHYYNCLDACATLESWFEFERRAKAAYPNTDKFSPRCLDWFNDLLWSVIQMTENGAAGDRAAFERLERKMQRKMARLQHHVWCRWQYVLCGEGALAFPQDAVIAAVNEANLAGDSRLGRTKKGAIQTSKDNLHFLQNNLPRLSETRTKLRFLEAFRKAQKIVGTYTDTMLRNPQEGLLSNDIAYPTWFAVPSFESDASGLTGGTQQGRLSAKRPSLPTMPKVVRKCMTSRFTPGVLIGADLSQIELRVAALLSGDPQMLHEYHEDARLRAAGGKGLDRHALMAELIFPEGLGTGEWYEKRRHVGKTLNFLMLYQGGWRRFQATVRSQIGLELSDSFCRQAIERVNQKYAGLRRWQAERVALAQRQGYLELAWSGISRTFLFKAAEDNHTYVSTICNFDVQPWAAMILQSAQRHLMDKWGAECLESLVVENTYDAIYVESPADEAERVMADMRSVMVEPPLYVDLQRRAGRTLPLAVEVKELRRVGT